MDDLYQALASEVIKQCPREFVEAELKGEVEEGVSTFSLRCRLPDQSEARPRIGGIDASNIDDAVVGIYEQMKRMNGGEGWHRFAFRLDPSGRFKFDVEYDQGT